MRTFNYFMKAIVFAIPLSFAISGHAQNAAIGCNAKFFVSYGQNNTSTSQTTVNQLSISSGGAITAVNFPTDPNSIGFNGMGLNPIDGYIYALRYPPGSSRVHLVKVGSGTPGNVTDLGEINNASGSQLQDDVIAYSGCFDFAGTFYFITSNDRMFSMPTSQLGSAAGLRNATYIAALNVPDYFADIAIDPTDGQMYGVTIGNDYGLYTINKATGAVVRKGTYPNSGSPMIGLFFTENGTLYAYRSNGAFFQLNKATAAGTSAGTGPSFTFADGCSCSFRVGHDLDGPLAICPTVQNGGQPTFNFTLSIQNSSGAARTGTTYTLTLNNRFRFTQTTAVIAANFAAAGLTNSGAAITSVSGGTNNNLVVSGMTIPNLSAVPNVLIGAQLMNHIGFTTAPFQSTISGLPAGIGTTDISNDPKTAAPDDPTVIGRCPGIPLSVKLINFSASYKNNISYLNWQTDNELNSDRYEIERSSDAVEFSKIGTEMAKGNSGGAQQYRYDDNIATQSGDVFYYRLKMYDMAGEFTYSAVVMVKRTQKNSNAITISPNPVAGSTANVILSATQSGKAELTVVDITGQVVMRQQPTITEGNNSIAVNGLDKLLPGVYVIRVVQGDNLSMVKFVIAR